ncbi:MAG: hypothetical protein R3F53_08855 [Gammaproteobacteria bacterium]
MTARELGLTVDTYNDGLRVAEITVQGKRIDLILQGPERTITETQGIANLPVVTASGTIVPAGSLAHIEMTAGLTKSPPGTGTHGNAGNWPGPGSGAGNRHGYH